MSRYKSRGIVGSPLLTDITLNDARTNPGQYPFDIPLLSNGFNLALRTPVTFLERFHRHLFDDQP